MIRRAILAALLLAPLPALAQAPAETRLRISEEGSVLARPDELSAMLRVEIRAATAPEAQEQLNRKVAAALAAIRAVPGIRVTTSGSSASTDAERQQTVATQSVQLRGADGEALLALVARLQAEGLLLDQAGWNMTDAAARTARDAATREAIRAVQLRAAAVARELGLRVHAMRELFVEANPEARPMMALRGGAGPTEPSVTAEEITTTARVTADFLLRR